MVAIYEPLILKWLHRAGVTGSEAEDICQEVLTTLVREVDRFEHSGRSGAWRAWLRQITVNRTRQFWQKKKEKRGDTVLLDQLEDPQTDVAAQWDREHDQHVLRQLLKLVEVEFQAPTIDVFRLTYVEGLSAKEVASRKTHPRGTESSIPSPSRERSFPSF